MSQMLDYLDLQILQEKPVNMNLKGKEFLMKRNLPGQRIGIKPWFDLFAGYLSEEFIYKFNDKYPCLGRNEKNIILIHMDDLIS